MSSSPRILLPALALAAFAGAQQPQPHRIDDAALKNAGKAGQEWLTYGLDQGETRYSPLTQINTSNVSRLTQAWSYNLGVGGGNQEGTPLVWNGTLYGITNWSVVFALDARTGKEKWRWDPQVNQPAVRAKICCGVVNRGVAIYNGKIIAPIIDGRLEALDAETGRPVWESRVAYAQDNYTITMAPRIAKGKVIIGMAGAELLIRGQFAAFDADTGKLAWRFYTVPGDPSKPFENPALKKAAETWSGEWWKLGGGGSVWDGMAYDPEADLFYVGTGNGGPWPEQLRQSKGKDNLYVCSILAVKPETGELKWYFQPVPGDSWDFDSVQQLLLADITIKGKPRKVIMQANKDGFYYVIDRVTGQFISGKPFAQVTWAKGLDEVTGRPFINPEAHYGNDSITIMPGPGGAHNWAPMSFNPKTGLVYIPTSTNSSSNFAVDQNFTVKPGRSNTGLAGGGRGPLPAGAKRLPPPPAIGPVPAENNDRRALVAWDPATQTERWRAPEGGSIGGGTVTTAGNLVFQVTNDGRLIAYSADKGEKLLEIKTDLGGGMGPPITYQLDGKQYVTIAGGLGKVVPRYRDAPGEAPPAAAAGPNAPPDLAGPPSANPTSSAPPKMLTFVLDAKGQ
ncbi:MAG TPA: PQQ-dependent dehydrogenase, methanol/ethanol family [Bryobacteraceae bacterium]|jgi:PQQ-dependent dehydrogenase (methanol/ethanol family)|nr:PQQ-dependent dehydrogenase, methanol/ethanol family [Bryobacteraceae bacterium]